MKQVDMSDKAVTARLKRVSQLRRLCLSLKKAKLPGEGKTTGTRTPRAESSQTVAQKEK